MVSFKITIVLAMFALWAFNFPAAAAPVADLKAPNITLAGVQLVSVNLSGAEVAMQLVVGNPNETDITVDAIFYQLTLMNTLPLRGKIVQRETFPAGRSRKVSVPVSLPYNSSLPALLSVLQKPEGTEYTIQGKIKLKDSLELIEFEHEGIVNLNSKPAS